MQTMWQNGSANLTTMDTYMKGIADSMTATVRMRGDTGPSAYAIGSVLVSETCINVRWGWLSWPITSVVLDIVFLILLIFRTARQTDSKTPLWKSSALATLFSQVDRKAGRIGVPNETKSHMYNNSKTTRVTLSRGLESYI